MKDDSDMRHIILDAEDTLAKAMSDIMQTRKAVIVIKNGQYFGMIDSGNLRWLSDDPNVLKAGHVAVRAPVINEETTLLDTCKLFLTTRLKALPLVERGKIIGVMSFLDLLKRLASEKVLDNHKVNEIMSRPGVRIDENSSLAQAQALMRKKHVRRLIVTKDGALAGILSTYDMTEVLLKPREKVPMLRKKTGIKDLSVKSLMQSEVATVSQDESLTTAANKMVAMNVASLVVVDGNTPVGVVTAHDILETVFATEEPSIHISGLYGENRSLYPEVINTAKKEIAKLERSRDVGYLSLHFKFEKSLCTVKARLMMNGIYNASASDYTVLDAVKKVLRELDKITRKDKQSKMHMK